MKIAVFGASGQTGVPLIIQALANPDIQVKALVRNVEKLKTLLNKEDEGLSTNERLSIVEINEGLQSDGFSEHLADVEVVVSTLGFPITRPSKQHLEFTQSVVAAMNKTPSCRRLILMHSWYTEPSSRAMCPFYLRWTLLQYIGPILDDMRTAEQYLANEEEGSACKDIDFTCVLPAGLSNKPVTDMDFLATEDAWCVEAQGGMIARADVARYILKTAVEHLHSRKIVAIATK